MCGIWQHAELQKRAEFASLSHVKLKHFESIDPHLLYGLVNTELRNHSESLQDLVKTHNLEEQALITRLGEAGYSYQPELNQFR